MPYFGSFLGVIVDKIRFATVVFTVMFGFYTIYSNICKISNPISCLPILIIASTSYGNKRKHLHGASLYCSVTAFNGMATTSISSSQPPEALSARGHQILRLLSFKCSITSHSAASASTTSDVQPSNQTEHLHPNRDHS